jgi:hypothetical protein
MRKLGIAVVTISSLLIVGLTPAYSEAPLDTAALSGLKELKLAFDVHTGNSYPSGEDRDGVGSGGGSSGGERFPMPGQ